MRWLKTEKKYSLNTKLNTEYLTFYICVYWIEYWIPRILVNWILNWILNTLILIWMNTDYEYLLLRIIWIWLVNMNNYSYSVWEWIVNTNNYSVFSSDVNSEYWQVFSIQFSIQWILLICCKPYHLHLVRKRL